ncbi:MAG: amino acid adenylation domain-containing protein, partial [Gammaproteobacteria bacterium]|nr:amino acid adenylation domain-containing protein [Gammaproteobacteria bacterium]
MSRIAELMTSAEQLGIQLWVEANELCFKAPKGALNTELKTALSEHKADIIAFLQKKQEAFEAVDEHRFPLSHGQQALWFVYQETPDSPAYNMASALHISSDADSTALQRALHQVIKRHAQLRMHFEVDSEGGIWQQVTDKLPKLEIIEAGRWGWEELLEKAYRYSQQPFDLMQSGLRAALFQQANDSCLLVFVLHHIFYDARSIGIIQQEWLTLYAAETQGQPVDLPALPMSYAHYVRDEAKWLDSLQGRQSAEYWHQQLAGEVPVLNLPADHPRPRRQTFHGASYRFCLSPALSARLTVLAQNQKTSLFTLLLGAFQVLLHRYTGQTDIWVGTPTSAGRLNDEFSQLAGYFVNPVVLRSRFTGQSLSFQQLITQLHSHVIEALAHQAYPFPLLVQRLHPQRDTGSSPLFQVMFSWHSQSTEPELVSAGLSYVPVDLPQMQSQFDVSLTIAEGTEFGCVLNYKADLFNAERIEHMAQHLTLLLEGIVAQPGQDIHQYPLLTASEIQKLQTWNQTETDCPKDKTIVDLFEEQVEKAPDNIAVVFENLRFTYAELNRRANRLAHALIALGVQADTLVGICVERSLEMVVGLLGILKAGGAYVPLDPDYPRERLHFMLEDSQAPVLLTQSFLQERLPELPAKAVCLDKAGTFQEQPSGNPDRCGRPEDLAYVIYTSGSTGKPKGCLMTHANVSRLFTATENWYHFNENDVWTLFHSYAFDFSVWELWGALCFGGKLVVVPYLTSRSPDAFLDLLIQHQVTVLNQTPSAFSQLIQADRARQSRYALRWVIFGGEALDLSSLKPWFAKHGDQQPRLINMYGITETTVHVTCYPLSHQSTQRHASVIGQAIPDLNIHLLDRHNQPLPIGIPGELCIAGAGLARGYLNRPGLTAEKFIEVELLGKVQRIYKTGDLARWLPDGNLEYLGRIDCQIKLRGFRIEPGEIEAVLSQHDAVKEAVVILHEREGNQSLAAYVTMFNDQCSMTNETAGSTLNIDNCSLNIELR